MRCSRAQRTRVPGASLPPRWAAIAAASSRLDCRTPRCCLGWIVSIIRIHRRSFWVTWQVLVITRGFMSERVGSAMLLVASRHGVRILPGSGGSRKRLRPPAGSGLRNGIRGGQPAQRGECS